MPQLHVVEYSSGPGVAAAGSLLVASGIARVTKFARRDRFGFGDGAVDGIISWLDRGKTVHHEDPHGEKLASALASASMFITDDPRIVDEHAAVLSTHDAVGVLRSLSWPTGAVSDLLIGAESATSRGNGLPDREPLFGVGNRIAFAGGLYLYCGLLLGAPARRHGIPLIDIPLEGVSVGLADQSFPPVSYSGRGPTRSGSGSSPRVPRGFYPCKDGYINLFINSEREWERLRDAIADPRLDEARFASEGDRVANRDELREILIEWLADKSRDDVLQLSRRHRLACLPMTAIDEVGAVLRDCGKNETWQQLCLPESFRDADAPPARPEPVDDLRPFGTARTGSTGAAPDPARPLAGLRVVELTTGWAGPIIGRQLANAGAEVIKIESERHWDAWRGPQKVTVGFNRYPDGVAPKDGRNSNALYNTENRGKLSALVDLQQEAGRDIFRRLVAEADIVVENLAPGSLDRLGLSHPELLEVNPRLTMCSVRAAGRSDDIVGWAGVIESLSGIGSLLGYPDDPRPMGSGTSWVDPLTGMWATALLLTELRTGSGGRHVTTSMLESVLASVPEPHLDLLWARRWGNRYPGSRLQGTFRASGEDSWVVISCDHEDDLAALADWLDETIPAGSAPEALEARLRDSLTSSIAQLPAASVVADLRRRGVSATVLRTFQEVLADARYREAGVFVPADHPVAGHRWYPESPLGPAEREKRRAPLLGEHNAEVWQGIVGLSAAEFAALSEAGVIG